MKTLRLFLLFALLAFSSHGATITFSITNNAGPSSNTVNVFPVAAYANSDGSYQGVGLPLFVKMTNGFGSIALLPGNYLATNSDLCSQYTGPGAVGTPYGVVFAVPSSAGTFPFGLLALPSSAGNYNVFNYSGATLTNGVTTAGISNALGFIPLSPLQITNLFALYNSNNYIPGTNIFAVTNPAGTITWEVPTQWFVTNGLISLANLINYATTNYANGVTNNFTSIVYSNPVSYATLTQVTNVSYNETTNLGALGTNFTLFSVGTNSAAQLASLQATNTALVGQLNGSNAIGAASLLAATNALWSGKQASNSMLTALAGTGAYTNAQFAGTNMTAVTNLSSYTVTYEVPTQWFITNSFGSMSYQSAGSYMLASLLPGLTNGFLPLNGTNGLLGTNIAALTYYPLSNPSNFISALSTNGLATTNFVLLTIIASNANFITFAQVQSSNNLAITSAGILATNYGQQVSNNLSTLSYQLATFGSNNVVSASNNIIQTANANISTSNTANLVITTNLVVALQNRAVTNTQASVSFGSVSGIAGSMAVTLGAGSLTVGSFTLNTAGLASSVSGSPVINPSGINGGGLVSNSVFSVLATNFVNQGLLATSNNITSNNIAGFIDPGQIRGGLPGTNGFLPLTNAFAQNQFGFGARTNFNITTNVIGILSSGSVAAGTYIGIPFNMTWTNVVNTNFTILASSGTYFLMSNSVTLYSSPNLVTWAIVSGVAPAPNFGFIGTQWHMTGTVLDGQFWCTNLQSQWMFSIANYFQTNKSFGGVVSGIGTNLGFTTTGSNYIYAIVQANNLQDTNGASPATVSNIVVNFGGTLFTNDVAVISVTNIQMLGSGLNGGVITFPNGEQIYDGGPNHLATDSGISVGAGNGQIAWERFSTIGGATNDIVGSASGTAFGNTISGGVSNTIGTVSGQTWWNTIGGGLGNFISFGQQGAVIAGGYSNSISGTGNWGFIAGGLFNQIGPGTGGGAESFVSGVSSYASNNNCFIFNGNANGSTTFASTASGEALFNLGNGMGINTNDPRPYTLLVRGSIYTTNLTVNGNSETLGISDSTGGFTVNGIPIGGGGTVIITNQGANTTYLFGTNYIAPVWFFNSNVVATAYFVNTNAQSPGYANANPVFGGLYISATNNNSYYTNINGMQFIPYPAAVESPVFNYHPTICSNFVSLSSGGFPIYASVSFYGVWNGINTAALNTQILVSPSNSVSSSVGQVSINTNNPSTNTLYIQGSLGVNGDIIATNFIGNGSGIANASTADPTSLAFLKAAGITDISAKNDLQYAVNSEMTMNSWASIIQASLFFNRFNPTNHISLIGNPWIATNEIYGSICSRFGGTNTMTMVLPQALTNCSLSIFYRQDASAANAFTVTYKNGLVALFNTNTSSTLVLNADEGNSGNSVDTSIGTTFFTAPTSLNGAVSNIMMQAQSGYWASGVRAEPVFWTCLTVSFNSNGLCSTYRNGNTNLFQLTSTNRLIMQSVTTADVFNTLIVGDGGPAWHGAGTGFTNANYADIAGVIVHNQSCESNSLIPVADFQFFTDCYKASRITDFVGASREWNPIQTAAFTGANGIPFTNEWTVLYAQDNPDELVFNDAYPGSIVANYATTAGNPGTGGNYANNIATVASVANIDRAKYYDRTIKECSGDNDIYAGTAQATVIANHNAFYLPYITNGTKVALFERGPNGISTGPQNAAMRTYFEQLKFQFSFCKSYDEWIGLTMPYLASVACDVIHVGATNTVAGYNGAAALALFISDKSRLPYSPQYYQVSSTVANYTNTLPLSQMSYGILDTNGNIFGTSDGQNWTNLGGVFSISTNSTQLTLTNLQSCRGTYIINLAFDDVTGGNPSCFLYETNLVWTNFLGTISPNLSGLTLVGTVSTTNLYTFPAQTNSTLVIRDTSSGGAATRKVTGKVEY